MTAVLQPFPSVLDHAEQSFAAARDDAHRVRRVIEELSTKAEMLEQRANDRLIEAAYLMESAETACDHRRRVAAQRKADRVFREATALMKRACKTRQQIERQWDQRVRSMRQVGATRATLAHATYFDGGADHR